jgi:hypothetical protein
MAEFRSDLEAFVPLEIVEKCVEPGCFERPPERGKRYFGFCDPSGGSNDAMTLAIAHNEGDRVILDALRERRAPFKPSEVVHEFGQLLKQYQCTTVEGDRYAGEWPREQFQKRGITYLPAKKTRTELYVELLPRLNGATIELLKNDRLVHQLVSLERRTTRGGKDSIDHPPGAHDDIANAVAGVAHHAATATRNRVATKTIVGLNW